MTERLVGFARLSDAPPPERELLEVADDGSATAWRSTGRAVGRFAGPVAAVDELRAAVDAAHGGPAPAPREVPPGASIERVEVEGGTARVVARRPAEGPWGPLVEACRAALEAIVDHPAAAIAIVPAADGSVRLEHRGTDVLPIELGSLEGSVRRWHDGTPAGEARLVPRDADLVRVDAGPGWSMELPADGAMSDGPGILTAEVTFVADDDGVYVPVRLTASLPG